MAANQLIGTILSIGATQDLVSKSGNSFKRRELVLMLHRFDPNTGEPIIDSENTPQLTFIGERCGNLDGFQPGQVVVVSFNIQGRKYTDQSGVTKIINDIQPYRIELHQSCVSPAPQVANTLTQVASPSQQPVATQPAMATPGYPQGHQPAPAQSTYPQGAPQGGYTPPF